MRQQHLKKLVRNTAPIMRLGMLILMIASILILAFSDAEAANKKKKKASNSAENPRYAALVMDASTGEILMARNADSIRHPASLTKMMTLYMVFEAVEQGRLRMSDRIPISQYAASKPPTKLGLPVGATIRVEDAVKILVTESANDISAAIGEKLGGTEKRFAANMTARAHKLGMSRTTFRNASGLPDPQQVTTARDMARLGQALLKDFPQYYSYFGIKNFEYRGRNHGNHNRLLGEYPGLDGIKTGFINASGFNLVASAKQNNRRLIGVVFGGRSWRSRNEHMVKLLDQGFLEIGKRKNMVQEASLAPVTAPIPLPPPMLDDIRGVAPMALSEANATDEGESQPDTIAAATMAATAAAASNAPLQQVTFEPIAPMDLKPSIPTMQTFGDMAEPVTIDPPVADETVTAARQAAAAAAAGVPIPPQRPVLPNAKPDTKVASAAVAPTANANIQMAPVAKGAKAIQTTSAPTVMQLTLKRDQIPAGLSGQIASNQARRSWSVQVGAFHSRAMTDQALRTAQSRLPTHLQHAQAVIVPQNTGGAVLFRGRLQGFDEVQANAACAHLGACLVVSPGS